MAPPRHILITGASSGLGAALAHEYASPGMRLSLHGRDHSRLAAVAHSLKERGAEVHLHSGSVTDAEDLALWIQECDARAEIDLVIANAGISSHSSSLKDAEIFDVNVKGVLNTLLPLIPLMKTRRRGQIALMSSLASFRGFAGSSAYCASKAAVRIYGEGLRAELKPYAIEVNVICPGFIKTPMTDANAFKMPLIMPAEKAAQIIKSGLAHSKPRIAFPQSLYWSILLLSRLPQSLLDILSARFPQK